MLTRIITALIGIPLVLGVAWLGGPYLLAFLALLSLLMSREMEEMWHRLDIRPSPEITRWGGLLFLLATYFDKGSGALALLAMYALTRETLTGRRPLRRGGAALLTVLYTGGLLWWIYALHAEMGRNAVFTLLLIVWSTDTAAYFLGTGWGKTPLCPSISPKKTREGALAGLVAGTFVGSLGATRLLPLSPGAAMVGAAAVSLSAQLGDLVESAIKREAEVKDSGSLLPGHGGFLDRFDSLLFAAPAAYHLLSLWM
ncbi:MAG: phosphatidate cytidylyltransferase [Limnochordia bacterium]|jgi:phosphatidate cytidylyltransferase|nr:phosphatidate cytidylyltransferase [Bacillota bacterium]